MGKFSKSNFCSEVKRILDQVSTNQQQIVTATSTASTANTVASEAKAAIGTLSSLETEKKTTLVEAINEVKQLGNSVKQSMVSSLLSVDSSLPISTSSTWDEVIAQTRNIQAGVDINGVIEQYKVQAGATISAGDFVEFVTTNGTMSAGSPIEFNSANTEYISAVVLNENKVIVSYRNDGNSGYYTAIVLTINDTSITKGSSITLGRGGTVCTSVVKLNETKVLVSYRDSGNNNYGTAIVLTINGTSITAGSPIVFSSAITDYISAVTLNENKVLVSYRDNGNSSYGTAIVLTINRRTINR